jgi:uncharacterized Zn finger protein (UPF0148 family)
MEIRGERECADCGTRWAYYETGSVACPDCGSLRSVGVEERRRHTDAPVTLSLSESISRLAEAEVADVAEDVQSACREYARRRGFVHAGDLRTLDDRFLLAHELTHAVDVHGRLLDPGDDEERYVLALLRAAHEAEGSENAEEGPERPAPEAVPRSMREARGLGYAEAVDDYRGELLEWLDDHPDPEARKTLGTLGEQLKRVKALQGDVDPAVAERLVRIARDIGRYLREGEEAALSTARDRLDGMGDVNL